MNMCVIIIIITIYCIVLPDDLNTAGEVLQAVFDEHYVNVILLQLLVHHVNMRHDLMKQKKHNSSSCSIYRKPDVSLTVVLSNELSDVMFSVYGIRFS